MASSLILFLFLCAASQISSSNCLLLPVAKDPSTLQYLTHTLLGTSLEPIALVLDLAGPSLWLDCTSGSYTRPIRSCSIQCVTAHTHGGSACLGDNNNVCDLSLGNTITGSTATGNLVEGALAVGSMATIDQFLFSCAPTPLLVGLSSGARGMIGLGRTRIALPSQLASSTGSRRRFDICLSSSDGLLISGNQRQILPVANSLMYTPLVAGPHKQGYFVTVNHIKINGERVSLGASLDAEISTVVPFTKMESSVLATFVKAFAMAGTSMSRVAAVAPFEVCYESGGAAPEIDLVLQSPMVKWRVRGRNSMVRVSEEVVCLGFVDGGPDMEVPMVLGGYQLEDVWLQFDLGTSMLGFSNSLLTSESSCSQLRSELDWASRESL